MGLGVTVLTNCGIGKKWLKDLMYQPSIGWKGMTIELEF